jgi:hypothetical protein
MLQGLPPYPVSQRPGLRTGQLLAP